MMNNYQAMNINNTIIKDPSDLVKEFEDLGGHITEFTPFGEDPLRDHSDLISRRDHYFFKKIPRFEPIFYAAVNGDISKFREGLLYLIHITIKLSIYCDC